jgi:hypothetical protein
VLISVSSTAHIRRRGLPLQRLLGLVEQPGVLDRDGRLVGEGLEQRDLMIRKWRNRAPGHEDGADAAVLPNQRREDHRAAAHEFSAAPYGARHIVSRERIRKVHHALLFNGQPGAGLVVHANGIQRPEFHFARADIGGQVDHFVRPQQIDSDLRAMEQALAALGNLFEDRLRVGHRLADDLQHLGRRSLPLQRLLRLVEQAHVLDRDHCLVGKGLEQIDLALWRLAGLGPGDAEGAHRHVVLQHRDADDAPPRLGDMRQSVLRIGQEVFDRNRLSRQDRPPGDGALIGRHREQCARLLGHLRGPVALGSHVDQATVVAEDGGQLRLDQPRRAIEDDFEHGRHIGGRLADHPQNLADRGLVFERFAQLGRAFLDFMQRLLGFVEQPGVLQRDAHGRHHRLQQALVVLTEPARGVVAVERDHADQLIAGEDRHRQRGLARRQPFGRMQAPGLYLGAAVG